MLCNGAQAVASGVVFVTRLAASNGASCPLVRPPRLFRLRIARFVIVGFANVAREAVSQMTTLTIESQPLQRIRVLGRIRTFTILFATVAGVERIHFGKFRFALRLAMHSVSRFLKHAFDQAFVYNHRRMLPLYGTVGQCRLSQCGFACRGFS